MPPGGSPARIGTPARRPGWRPKDCRDKNENARVVSPEYKNYVVYICMHGPGQEEYLAILRVPMTRLPIAPQDPGPNPKNQPRLEVSAMT